MNDAVKKYNVVSCHKSLSFFLGHTEATGYGYGSNRWKNKYRIVTLDVAGEAGSFSFVSA